MRKNIVHYVTGQYMRQNKKRTFTTFLGIVFMVVLMTCVFVGKNTGLAFMEHVMSLKDGKWHVSFYDTNQKGLEEIQKLDYVTETAISANYGSTEFALSGKKERPYLSVKAYTENCFDWMNIELKEGRFPENNKELLLSESALKDGAEIKIGDTVSAEFFDRSITGIGEKGQKTVFPFFDITVESGETVQVSQDFPYYGKENSSIRENRQYTGKKEIYTVVGIMETPGFERAGSAGYTAITRLMQEEMEKLDLFNLSICCDLDRTPDLFGAELREKIPFREIEFNDYLLTMSQHSQDTTMNAVIHFLMLFFILLIMLVSVVLIYNVFNISYRERSRYLGMLSSVGATARQKRSSIYYEAFALLIPALFAGILLGMGVIKIGITAIKPLLSQFMGVEEYVKEAPVTLIVTAKELSGVVAVSILTVLVSAYLPARKISRAGAVASIRGNKPDQNEKCFRTKLPVGKGWLGERLLSRNLLTRQKKKTRAVLWATVTFFMVITVTSFGVSVVDGLVKNRIMDADMDITSDKWNYMLYMSGYEEEEDIYKALKEEIRENPTVTDGTEWLSGMLVGNVGEDVLSREYRDAYREIINLYYHRPLSDEEFEEMYERAAYPLCIASVDDETLKTLAQRAGADYQLLKEGSSALVVREGNLSTKNVAVEDYVVDGFRNFHIDNMTDLKVGESFEAEFWSPKSEKEETISIEVAGFVTNEMMKEFMEFNSQFLWIITGADMGEVIWDAVDGDGSLSKTFYFRCDETDRGFLEKLDEIESENGSLFVAKMGQQADFFDAVIKLAHVLAVCFMTAVSLICFLNLFNSIRGRMEDRRGEFAVLRSIGMTGRQLQRMLLIENFYILIKSILYGSVVSVLICLFLKKAVTEKFGYFVINLPWGTALSAVCLAAGAVILLTLSCFRKEKNRNLIECIRKDSV